MPPGTALCLLPLQAGAQRLSALANLSESGALAAIDGDAIPKLLHLLEHSDDQGATCSQAPCGSAFAWPSRLPDASHCSAVQDAWSHCSSNSGNAQA